MKLFLQAHLSIIISILFVGCGGDNKNEFDNTENITIDKNITVSEVPYVQSIGIGTQIHAQVSLGDEPKDIYVLLSNYAKTNGIVEVKKSVKIVEHKKIVQNIENFRPMAIHAPHEVEVFRRNIKNYLDENITKSAIKKNLKVARTNKNLLANEKEFYLDYEGTTSTIASIKKVTSTSTIYGTRKLSIWVSNDSYGIGCSKKKCVTQGMVNALANTFLQKGIDNDIYDWVSNVYGEEWGKHSNPNLIGKNDEITILLTDIGKDNSKNGGVVGYYFPKDNFIKEKFIGSNERIMLYADSVIFANGEGRWDINDYWPKEMVSTLAHEMQHMIHFYQKSVLLKTDATDTWINEMLSESTEDLIASKIHHTGSRGVPYTIGSAGEEDNRLGRYPLFNANNRLSLTTWHGSLENYSVVNAFGAFLLRNYGGAKVLHDIMHSAYIDEEAIVSAVNKTPQGRGKKFNDLLKEWGIAVLLSDNNHLDTLPTYNTGGYMPNQYKHSVYDIGSINFFNYSPQPSIFTASGTVQRQGNYYYKVGTRLKGDIDIYLTLSGQTEATIIVK